VELGLQGKVAIVSGGSRGIGLATARELATEGCSVVIAARTQSYLDDAAAQIDAEAPGRVSACSADMTTADGVQAVVAHTHERFGPVAIAVSNVIGHVIDADKEGDGPGPGWFSTMELDGYRAEFRHLLVSAWLLARETIPDMRAQGWGRILNIGSHAAREPATHIPHVLPNTVRPAVAGLYRVLARKVAAHGITVNNVLTGAISTDRAASYWKWLAEERGLTIDEVTADARADYPLGRFGEPEEMAAVVLFLCSRRADHVTGQSVSVMGGGTKHLW
jgi:3-oxoacyl-[acyl-carrier protein] reductase